ncbi:hypothetical protein RHSIM_Rhsim11G0123600 [Rhododendron simsii]|uniref:Exonuclease domain-containing protein n=1 Tax=Rhododendron simsii TaxID=118357 RepID=A0A834G5S2_RHOSS|nr:hypothetical protein RHSIM_Rhsim11G0123600 [Rhododendron simsii]
MNQLANSFSLLELDVGDDREVTIVPARQENANGKGKGKKKGDSSAGMTLSKNNNGVPQSLEVVSGDYKLPLVWIDLEMTGLNVEFDRILEIACIVTDGSLTKSVEVAISSCRFFYPLCIVHIDDGEGLTKKVLHSKISEQEAEKQVTKFVRTCVGTHTPVLAGNSVYMDFLFLKKYMPNLAGLFSHVLVDVSSVRSLCIRWYPRENKKAPVKEKKHRALDDIRESIAELKYYKEHIFKTKK